jgi:quinol monooxygenase YgiN
MSKFGFNAKITAVEGKRDELASLLLEAAEALRSFEGCDMYLVSEVEGEPDALSVTEVWSDADKHRESLQLESTQQFIQHGRTLIAGFESVKLRVLGGKGL